MDTCKVLATVFCCCLWANAAAAEIYEWTDDNGKVHYTNLRPTAKQSGAQKTGAPSSAKTTVRGVDNGGQFDVSGGVFLRMRKMVERGKFDELNHILHNYQTASESDPAAETILFTSYYAFGKNDSSFETLLNEWVEATPQNYQPYLARATYYDGAGWNARGSKWASETTQEQFRGMDAYFNLARQDIAKAIALYEKSIVPYEILIGIANAQGQDSEAEEALRKAVAINPATFKVRAIYLNMIAPRWGGTFEQMQSFVDESLSHVSRNPKLLLLPGQILDETAAIQCSAKKYSVAEQLQTQALSHGENHVILYHRGRSRHNREHYAEALQDLDRAIEMYKDSSDYYYWRSRTYYKLERYDEAADDIEAAASLEPNDKYINQLRTSIASQIARHGHELEKHQQTSDALAQFDTAIELEPDNAIWRYNKALALIDANQLDSALSELERAMVIDPDEINFYVAIDHVLAIRRDWDRIIEYWDDYILNHPDSSRAYLERSGSYHHKGDREAALSDLERAAELGSPQAKQLLGRYKR